MPKEGEVNDEPTEMELYGTGAEVPLIELAALYAHGVLSKDGGRLSDSVDPNVYDGLDNVGEAFV